MKTGLTGPSRSFKGFSSAPSSPACRPARRIHTGTRQIQFEMKARRTPPKLTRRRPPPLLTDSNIAPSIIKLEVGPGGRTTSMPRPRVLDNSASSRPLKPEASRRLLERADKLKVRKADIAEFQLSEGSPPPPIAGQAAQVAFRPKRANRPTDEHSGPLTVLRASPEGEVPTNTPISITFSKPMVALTTQDDVASTVPAQLTPTVAGRWRWVGTRTLIFSANDRLPHSTHFEIVVPEATRSVSGEDTV